MPTLNTQEYPRFATYTVGATSSTGPFNIPFPFQDNDEVAVWVNGVDEPNITITQASLYSTSGNFVTLDVAVTNATVIVWSDTGMDRSTGDTFVIAELSKEIDRIFANFQEASERTDRTVRIDKGLAKVDSLTPGSGTVIGFDASGALTQYLASGFGPDKALLTTPYFATGDGATATYTLPYSVTDEREVMVYIDGVKQLADGAAYTVSGQTLTLAENLPNGSLMEVAPRVVGTNSSISATNVSFAHEYATVSEMTTNTTHTYSDLPVGEYVRVLDGNFVYKILASGSSGDVANLVSTPVQFQVLPGDSGYNVKAFGAEGDGTTDDRAAIQAAIDAAEADAHGFVYMPPGHYRIGAKLTIPEHVILQGSGSAWENYGLAYAGGTMIEPTTGATITAGDGWLELVYNGTETAEQRHMGGPRDLTINGLKGTHSDGNGIKLIGTRFGAALRCHAVRCGEAGFTSVSDGGLSSNEVSYDGCFAGWNDGNGFEYSGGDSQLGTMMSGFNGLSGFSLSGGRLQMVAHAWDNGTRGVYISADKDVQGMIHAQDNDEQGVEIVAGRVNLMIRASSNGKDTGAASNKRVGVKIAAGVVGSVMITTGNTPGFATQQYGVYNLSTDICGTVSDAGNAVGMYYTGSGEDGFPISANGLYQALSLADDAAGSFNTPRDAGLVTIIVSDGSSVEKRAVLGFVTEDGGAALTSLSKSSGVDLTTGTLSAFSGTDGNITISAHTNRRIYVSNRLAVTATVKVQWH